MCANTGRMNHSIDGCAPVLGRDTDGQAETAIGPSAGPSIPGAMQPVLDAQSLIGQLGLGNAIGVLRIKLAFPPEVFALAALPLIDGIAEFVQMLPVLGSVRFAQPGGQLHRALAGAIRALDRRRAQILPRGAAPEVIGAQAQRWTYAVLVAALLRDLHQVSLGMRVWMSMSMESGTGTGRAWSPAAGSMRDGGVLGYCMETLAPGALSEGIDPTIKLRLFERCVPALILEWLREDPALMAELRNCLSERTDGAGVINELVGCDAPTRSQPGAKLASSVPEVPIATPDGEAGFPAGQAVATVDKAEFLEEVRPEESALAMQFMAWLGQGVLGGTLPVNTADASMFVVAEGLLLCSPRIFREFAKHQMTGSEAIADAARRVQRDVLRQGWHLRADGGVNILSYEQSQSGRATNRINGIVIREPMRFIRPLPDIEPTLVRVMDGAGPSLSSSLSRWWVDGLSA
jgi:hypothetical protein